MSTEHKIKEHNNGESLTTLTVTERSGVAYLTVDVSEPGMDSCQDLSGPMGPAELVDVALRLLQVASYIDGDLVGSVRAANPELREYVVDALHVYAVSRLVYTARTIDNYGADIGRLRHLRAALESVRMAGLMV